MWFPQDPSTVLGLSEHIAAIGLTLSSLELLHRAPALAPTGLLSWPVASLRSPALAVGPFANLLNRCFNPPGIELLCALRLASAILLFLFPSATLPSLLTLTLATLTSLLLMLRTSYGNDGADQMMLIVLIPATLARWTGQPRAITYALWFIAMQCCLSYLTSGIAKVKGKSWRDGTGLTGVLSTRTYGIPALARLFRSVPALATASSWAIILTEIGFPVILIAPPSWVPWILAGGFSFHLATAIVMGLNAFVWSFGAAYPALAFAALRISN